MNNMPVFLFIIISALSMNLLLQCGLGITVITASKKINYKQILIKFGIIFLEIILLWFVFARIITPVISGFFMFVLLFPVCSVVYDGLEFLVFNFILKEKAENENSIHFAGGITAVALFICLNLANGFKGVLSLSLGFMAGTLFVFLIIGEIKKKSELENVPRFLRGKPLTIISMALLSLIFSTASLLLFRIITEAW
jgi:electron transport complex protein RnfA